MNTAGPFELVPESFGLLREYYTTTAIAETITALLSPTLPELAPQPNVGIGRIIRAFTPHHEEEP
jgi:hypothetical protein